MRGESGVPVPSPTAGPQHLEPDSRSEDESHLTTESPVENVPRKPEAGAQTHLLPPCVCHGAHYCVRLEDVICLKHGVRR